MCRFIPLLLILLSLATCCTIDQEFVESMERPADLLLPDLVKVYEADPNAKIVEVLPALFDEDARTRRLKLIKEWKKNIQSAKETSFNHEDRLPFGSRLHSRTIRYDENLVERIK